MTERDPAAGTPAGPPEQDPRIEGEQHPLARMLAIGVLASLVGIRAKPGDMRDGPPIHGHTRLEVIWVTVPFIMVTALAVYAWIVLDDIEAQQPDEMVVQVTGRQFTWSFE